MLATTSPYAFCQNVEKGLIRALSYEQHGCTDDRPPGCTPFPSGGFAVYNRNKEKIGRLEKSRHGFGLYFTNESNVKPEMPESGYRYVLNSNIDSNYSLDRRQA